jgi:hypothetical protein
MKIPRSTASKVGLTLEKSPVDISLFFFLSPNKQKVEHQSESNSVTFWTPSPWKASLYCATLKKKKKAEPFIPTSHFKAACLKLQNKQVRITCHVYSPTHPRQNNPMQSLGRLNAPT